MNDYLQSVDLFQMASRFRKPLIIVGAVSLLASAIFSGPAFIKPRYKSFSILYPTNLTIYSQESPTEQIIQLLESADIRDKVITTFDLYKHYDIDTIENRYFRSDLIKMYEQNVSVNKTEYESAEIIVYDTDPVIAAAMVDSMIVYLNAKSRELQRSKSYEILAVAKRRMDMKKIEMDSLQSLLDKYRVDYGLLDYGTQSKEYTKALAKAIASGKTQARADAEKKLTMLAEKGGDFISWSEHLWRVRGVYNDLKMDYENTLKDVNKVLTYENIITRAVPSDKKAYPIRWLIVLVAVSVSLFLSFLVLLFSEAKTTRKSE